MSSKKNQTPKEKKPTVGEESLKLQKKTGEKDAPDSIELQQEIHRGTNSKKSYEEEVWETVDRGRRDSAIEGDFFVVVLFKKERHLKNIVRQLFFYRQSCPTPEYDQTVYQYHRKDDEMEYLWTVPNNAACLFLPRIEKSLPEEQRWLVSMVNSFNKGELDQLAERLNQVLV